MTSPVMAAPPAQQSIPSTAHPHGRGRPCLITRRAAFSASHRYWLPELTPEQNQARFGACSLAPGHGHNYELIVAMGGPLDADGMVLNLSDVKHAIREQVTAQLDFRYLNDAWPEFDLSRPQGMLPTHRRSSPLPCRGSASVRQTNWWISVSSSRQPGTLSCTPVISSSWLSQ